MRHTKRYFRYSLLLILVPGSLIALNHSPFFRAQSVECYTQFGSCPQTIVSRLKPFTGLSLLAPLPENQVRKSLSGISEILSVRLYRRLPITLVVSIALRKPLGSIGPNILGARAVSDDQGFIYQTDISPQLPLLLSDNLPPIATHLAADQTTALKILSSISPLSTVSPVGKLDLFTLTIYLNNRTQLLVDIRQPFSAWYPSLQLILSRSKMTSKVPSIIDLRFNSPVVTF